MLSRKGTWRNAMIHKLRNICFVVVGLLAVCVPLFAHHGNASYDTAKNVTVKGTVTEYVWANPHVFVKIDGKDEGGNTVHWIIESQNPVSMKAKLTPCRPRMATRSGSWGALAQPPREGVS